MKRCSVCKQVKPASMFSYNPKGADKLNAGCKPCRRYQEEQRRTGKGQISELLKGWKRVDVRG